MASVAATIEAATMPIYIIRLDGGADPQSPCTAWLADGRPYLATTRADHGAIEIRARSRAAALQIARRWSTIDLAAHQRIRSYA